MDDLSDLISQLTADGALDSSGQFSLDPGRFWDKARRYTLEDRFDFLRCLYRAISLGGATKIDIFVDAFSLRMQFNGDQLQSSQMGRTSLEAAPVVKLPRRHSDRGQHNSQLRLHAPRVEALPGANTAGSV